MSKETPKQTSKEQRKTVILPRSLYESLDGLTVEQQGEICYYILQYAFDGITPPAECSPLVKFAFNANRAFIDDGRNRYDKCKANGKKGGRPRKDEAANDEPPKMTAADHEAHLYFEKKDRPPELMERAANGTLTNKDREHIKWVNDGERENAAPAVAPIFQNEKDKQIFEYFKTAADARTNQKERQRFYDFLSDSNALLQICEYFKLEDLTYLNIYFSQFVLYCEENKSNHLSGLDIRRHFCSWLLSWKSHETAGQPMINKRYKYKI